MNDVNQVIAIIGGLIVLVTFIGSAAVFIRGSVYKGAITALQSTVDTQDKNIKAQEQRIISLEQAEIANKATIESLKRENGILLAERPSADVLHDLNDKLEMHHKTTIRLLEELNV